MNEHFFSEQLNQAWQERRSKLNNSAQTARELLGKCELIGFKKGVADCHKILGYCFWRFTDFSNSLQHSMQALTIYRELNYLQGEADALNSLGAVYMYHKNHQKRLECNLKCLEIRQQIGHADDISGSMNNIGETYLEMEEYELAEKWFNDCIQYPGATEDSIAWGFHNLGKLNFKRNNTSLAIEMYKKSISISTIIQYETLTTETYLELCVFHKTLNNNQLAIEYGEKALQLAEKNGAKEEIKNAYLLLSEIVEIEHNIDLALRYFKQYHKLHSEVFDDSNFQRIKDLEHRYELDAIRKEHEIERLRNVELKNAYSQIENQKELLEIRNKDIIDSIRYAKRIQQALLSQNDLIQENQLNHFIYFKPKDIVSGDFYWMNLTDTKLYIAVGDCTGHGVPGGFLTMLGIAYLNEILSQTSDLSPAEILSELKLKFSKKLGTKDATFDGMDISICAIHRNNSTSERKVEWAGANNPLWYINPNSSLQSTNIVEIKGDKFPIGNGYEQSVFKNHTFSLPKGTILYLFSDGYADQFGGDKNKKLKQIGFKKLINTIHNSYLKEQETLLENFLTAWKGENEQVDDICIVGVQL
jgi:serine phosphatase RsbU (regulator of sigma subunit)